MKRPIVILLVASLIIAGLVSWFASTDPDGLERVAEDLGFSEKAEKSAVTIMPDYSVPGLRGFLSNGTAGVIGVLASFGMAVLIGRLVNKRKKNGRS